MASRDRGRVRANDESAHRGYCRHQESKVAVDVSVAAIHCPVLSKQRWRLLHAGRSTAWNAQSAPKTRRGPQPQNGRARTSAFVKPPGEGQQLTRKSAIFGQSDRGTSQEANNNAATGGAASSRFPVSYLLRARFSPARVR